MVKSNASNLQRKIQARATAGKSQHAAQTATSSDRMQSCMTAKMNLKRHKTQKRKEQKYKEQQTAQIRSPSSQSSFKQPGPAFDQSWFLQNSNETDLNKPADSMYWPVSSAMKKPTTASCDRRVNVQPQAVPLATRNQTGRLTKESPQKQQINPCETFRPSQPMQQQRPTLADVFIDESSSQRQVISSSSASVRQYQDHKQRQKTREIKSYQTVLRKYRHSQHHQNSNYDNAPQSNIDINGFYRDPLKKMDMFGSPKVVHFDGQKMQQESLISNLDYIDPKNLFVPGRQSHATSGQYDCRSSSNFRTKRGQNSMTSTKYFTSPNYPDSPNLSNSTKLKDHTRFRKKSQDKTFGQIMGNSIVDFKTGSNQTQKQNQPQSQYATVLDYGQKVNSQFSSSMVHSKNTFPANNVSSPFSGHQNFASPIRAKDISFQKRSPVQRRKIAPTIFKDDFSNDSEKDPRKDLQTWEQSRETQKKVLKDLVQSVEPFQIGARQALAWQEQPKQSQTTKGNHTGEFQIMKKLAASIEGLRMQESNEKQRLIQIIKKHENQMQINSQAELEDVSNKWSIHGGAQTMTAKQKRDQSQMIKMIEDCGVKLNEEFNAAGLEMTKKQLIRKEGDPMQAQRLKERREREMDEQRLQAKRDAENAREERLLNSVKKIKEDKIEEIRELKPQQSIDMWSESDASDHRVDEKHIEMENTVMHRFFKASYDGHDDEQRPEKFTHRKENKLSKVERTAQIATNYSNWFVKNAVEEVLPSYELIEEEKSLSQQEELEPPSKIATSFDPTHSKLGLQNQKTQKLISINLEVSLLKASVAAKNKIEEIKGEIPDKKNQFNEDGENIDFLGVDKYPVRTPKKTKKRQPAFKSFAPEINNTTNQEEEQLKFMDIDKDQIMVKRSKKPVNQMKLYEISQNSHRSSFCKVMERDPDHIYHKHVDQSLQVILPIISKICEDGILILKDYTLDSGHLGGLVEVLKKQAKKIQDVLFDNCGIDDNELSILLEGFSACSRMNSFIYKNNEFLHKSLASIKPVLFRQDPHNLQELRLVNCVTTPKLMTDMVEFMIENKTQLRSLALVKMKVGQQCLKKIAQFVDDNLYLEGLDLSWNDLQSGDFTPLFHALSKNVSLKSLNLSCNMIIDKKDQNKEFIYMFDSLLSEYAQRRHEALMAGQTQILESTISVNHPVLVVYSLSRLIRYNKVLQSVILNNCGLNTQVMSGIVPAIRHAKSLLCLHMASNPGINTTLEAYYRKRLSILPETNYRLRIQTEVMTSMNAQQQSLLSLQQRADRENRLKNSQNWKHQSLDKYIENRRLQPLYYKLDANLKTDAQDLSITRILGYKQLIPGSGRWRLQTSQESDSCWVCDNWVYTLYFWNEKVGQYNERNFIGIDSKTKVSVVDKLRQYNKQTYMDNEDVPVLFSQNTKWRPRPFMKIYDFLETLSPAIIPPFDSIAHQLAMQHFEVQEFDQISPAKKAEIADYEKKTKAKMEQEWIQIRIRNAKGIIDEFLKFKGASLINYNQLNNPEMGELFVLPIFLPANQNDFMIRTPRDLEVQRGIDGGTFDDYHDYQQANDGAYRWYFRRYMSDIRKERIPLFTKELKKSVNVNLFIKEKSVFKNWQEDTALTVKKCLKNDQKFWKVDKICRDSETRKSVMEIINARYEDLKNIFTSACIMNDSAPNFYKREFFIFSEKAGFTTKTLNSGIIDTYFKATNFEEVDQDNNDDNALNRFEFIEILLRISRGKYIDFGKAKSLPYAFMTLLQTYILPMQHQLYPLQSWREEQLWCTEVNDILQVNQANIKKVYDHIASQKYVKSKNRIDDFTTTKVSIDKIRDTLRPVFHSLQIGDKTIVQAFFLSKMTVVDENENSNYEYTYLHWSEFQEFIGRVAWLKYLNQYQNDQWKLDKKIRVILKAMFKMVKEPLIEPPQMNDEISDSDDDY